MPAEGDEEPVYPEVEPPYAVECSESPNPRHPRRYPAHGWYARARSGEVGRYWAWPPEPCATWPARAAHRYTGPWSRSTVPVLTQDEEQLVQQDLYRDEQMAASLTWWHRFRGDRILLAAHDGHGALVSDSPEYPRPQGAFLRDRFGGGYVSLRTGFGRGSFVAYGPDTTLGTFTAGPPGPGSNEHRLERVPFRDCLLDLRTVPEPARRWLSVPRPTREIGTVWPVPPAPTALRPSSDPLVHLHRVEAARLLPE
ncbi:erythromycin esterase family protein [Streptomyces sp. NPDC058741]|uniref:erythromycin esterase family protein n=1 Tax=Streptomyces sp. NPDC058741 TaxID=3346620 RepID=UPI00369D6C34